MIIPGARRAVLSALNRGPMTAAVLFKMINWWTLPTIRETLRELETRGEVDVVDSNAYKLKGGRS